MSEPKVESVIDDDRFIVMQLVGEDIVFTDMSKFPAEMHTITFQRKDFRQLAEFIRDVGEAYR